MSDAWNSPAAQQLVSELNLASHPDTECWEPLAADIVDALKSDDDVRLARDLFTVHELIRLSRKELEKQFGHDCWARARDAIDDAHPWALDCLKLLQQLGAISRLDAKDTLVDIGRHGVRYRLPSGRKRTRSLPDCGLQDFVELSRIIPKLFERSRSTPPATMTMPAFGQSGKPSIAIHLEHKEIRLSLSIKGKPEKRLLLNGLAKNLVFALNEDSYRKLAEDTSGAADQRLWDQLWPTEPLVQDPGGGTPERIRTLVYTVNKKLTEKFGSRSKHWIERRSDTRAYVLTTGAKWKLVNHSSRAPLPTIDPLNLDGGFREA